MIRIRCSKETVEQTRLFCENNEIPFLTDKNETDFSFYSLEDAHQVSKFLFRVEELDRLDKFKEQEIYPLGLN